ncbi:hypothetical protein BZA77DRAFT_309578 [Pyronema omphalodes]|nr:hypothetical protein BZA77DRAFT_309578 [Pyronema omphalodes]
MVSMITMISCVMVVIVSSLVSISAAGGLERSCCCRIVGKPTVIAVFAVSFLIEDTENAVLIVVLRLFLLLVLLKQLLAGFGRDCQTHGNRKIKSRKWGKRDKNGHGRRI